MEEEMKKYDTIEDVEISKEMREAFLDYSMSVIVQRALPDVRDGMKPVHRRILHAMNMLGITSGVAHKKSARIVGEVIGKYHPHGDTAVYDAMVRMAQDFSYRYPLVDGHGNFGSLDGDGAAAMRYTEARMSKISMEMMRDINKETVDFIPNYDGEESEPVVLPSRIPNLLINGSVGIAVGMATNIPPHNLSETIQAIIKLMDDPDVSVPELMEVIKGPDFPTGGIILGRKGIRQAYETGRGSIMIRSKYRIEELDNGKKRIIFYEIPYQVNKLNLIKKMADLIRDKEIAGDIAQHLRLLLQKPSDLLKKGIYYYCIAKFIDNARKNVIEISKAEAKQRTLFYDILIYIDEHSAEELTLEILSKKFNYSKFYFSSMFNRHLGTNLKNYINNVRIKKAIELLQFQKNYQTFPQRLCAQDRRNAERRKYPGQSAPLMPLRQNKSVRFCPYYRKTSRLSITAHQMHRILTIFPSFARGFMSHIDPIPIFQLAVI